MNRVLSNDMVIEKGVVTLFGKITFGATGAPTLDTTYSKGITSVSRTSAGLYKLTFTEAVQKLLMVKHVFVLASGAPASPAMFVKSETVNSTATPVANIQFNAAGTATDPASGEIVLLEIVVKNSTV